MNSETTAHLIRQLRLDLPNFIFLRIERGLYTVTGLGMTTWMSLGLPFSPRQKLMDDLGRAGYAFYVLDASANREPGTYIVPPTNISSALTPFQVTATFDPRFVSDYIRKVHTS